MVATATTTMVVDTDLSSFCSFTPFADLLSSLLSLFSSFLLFPLCPDKRTQRKMDGVDYTAAIKKFRDELATAPAPSSFPASSSSIKVVVRKRPLFSYELERGEYT